MYFYDLYIKTLVGKLIKKGNRFTALRLYKKLREEIKLQTNKQKKIPFIFFSAMYNSMPKVSFKEIRLGSQKKDIPMPINKKKQVLVAVEALLKISRRNKKLELNKLVECIISSYKNKGIIIRKKRIKYKKAIENKILLKVFTPKNNYIEKKPYVSKKIYRQIYKNKTTL
jgi:ribosomal protein S7